MFISGNLDLEDEEEMVMAKEQEVVVSRESQSVIESEASAVFRKAERAFQERMISEIQERMHWMLAAEVTRQMDPVAIKLENLVAIATRLLASGRMLLGGESKLSNKAKDAMSELVAKDLHALAELLGEK